MSTAGIAASVAIPGVSATGVKSASKIAKAKYSGSYGEALLAKTAPFAKQYFSVPGFNGGRIVDAYNAATKTTYEAKTGYVSLTKSVQTQIHKDAQLLKTNNNVQKTIWNFYTSPVTGKGGPSKPVQKELSKFGIKYLVY